MSRYSFGFSTNYEGGVPTPHWLCVNADQVRNHFSDRDRELLRQDAVFGKRDTPAEKPPFKIW